MSIILCERGRSTRARLNDRQIESPFPVQIRFSWDFFIPAGRPEGIVNRVRDTFARVIHDRQPRHGQLRTLANPPGVENTELLKPKLDFSG